MSQTSEFPTEYIVQHEPRQLGEVSRWICMDDRFALTEGLFRQVGGGAAGIGIDWAITRELELQRLGYSSDVAEVIGKFGAHAPAQILGGLAAKEARPYGVDLNTHKKCAAELGALLIAEKISASPDEVFTAAKQVKPDLESSEFESVQAAFENGLVNYTIMDPDEGAHLLDTGTVWAGVEIPPVSRVDLAEMDHVAEDIGIDHQRGVAFDVRGALENGRPAYHVSFGDFEEIHAVINRIMPVKYTDFLTVSAIRHGAIALSLPRPKEEPLRVHAIGA